MAEIRRSPVEVGSLSRYLQGFSTIQTVVVWDFFHQQYEGSELSETSPWFSMIPPCDLINLFDVKEIYWHCWWKKSCTSWYGKYPIKYRVSIHVRWLAGFLPSTVWHEIQGLPDTKLVFWLVYHIFKPTLLLAKKTCNSEFFPHPHPISLKFQWSTGYLNILQSVVLPFAAIPLLSFAGTQMDWVTMWMGHDMGVGFALIDSWLILWIKKLPRDEYLHRPYLEYRFTGFWSLQEEACVIKKLLYPYIFRSKIRWVAPPG